MKGHLLLLLLLLPFCVVAQPANFDDLSQSVVGNNAFRRVELGRKMMQMMQKNSDAKLNSLLEGIRDIRIIATKSPQDLFENQAREVAQNGDYELISRTENNGNDTSFYFIDGGPKGESELLMLAFSASEQIVLNIRGRFDVRDISRLTQLSRPSPSESK